MSINDQLRGVSAIFAARISRGVRRLADRLSILAPALEKWPTPINHEAAFNGANVVRFGGDLIYLLGHAQRRRGRFSKTANVSGQPLMVRPPDTLSTCPVI